MNPPLKLLFDECVGKRMVKLFADLLAYTKDPPEVKTVVEYFQSGIYDEIWVPQIADQGWIVITGDSGQGGRGKGEKLPVVCRQYGVTHVVFGRGLQQQNGFEKIRAIMIVWPEICMLPSRPRASGWSLRRTTSGGASLVERSQSPTGTKGESLGQDE